MASRAVAHSIDCLHGIRDLAAYGTHFYAHFVLMRLCSNPWLWPCGSCSPIIGIPAFNVYLRSMTSWHERKKVYGLTDLPSEVPYAEGRAGLKRMIDHVGPSAADCRLPMAWIHGHHQRNGRPGRHSVIGRAGVEICSGVAHAKTWAVVDVTHETQRVRRWCPENIVPVYPTIRW